MGDPASVLFTIPNFITADSGRAMLNIIERLDKERFAPAVCVRRKGGALDRVVDELGIPFIEAPFTIHPKPYHTLVARALEAAKVFRPHRFTLWHSFHYADDYTEPIIARLSGAKAWIFTKKNMGWGSRAWRLRSLFATRIAAQNTDMLREFYGGWPLRNRSRLLPRGVVAENFTTSGAHVARFRERLGVPTGAVLAACVAHLLPVKGHPTLIDAVAEIADLHLLIAGKPLDRDYADALEQRVERLGIAERIHFLGGVSDVPSLLAESDIAVLPTWGRWRMEGCPVALLEAQAAGRACVATDIPGSRDIISHDDNGLLVPPEDSRALAGALRQLAADPDLRVRLGAAASRTVEARYNIEREVADHEELYADVLEGQG